MLESVGHQARVESQVKMLGRVTGKLHDISPFRPIRMIPEIAVRERAVQLAVLQGYVDAIGPKNSQYLDYLVSTTGRRLEIGESISARHEKTCKQITKFFRYALKKWDIELLQRSTEFTVDNGKEDGIQVREATWSVHLHHNILFWPRKALPDGQWSQFLRELHVAVDGVHVQNQEGKIQNLAELIKYQFKPAEMMGAPPEFFDWIFRETFKQRMLAKYNSLQTFARARKHQKYQWDDQEEAKSWFEKETRKRGKNREADKSDLEELTAETLAADIAAENVIVGQTSPMAKSCAWKEPHILVINHTEHPVTDKGKENLAIIKELMRQARVFWDLNGAPAPEIAIAVSDAWLTAKSDAEAEKIKPFITAAAGQPKEANADPDTSNYNVHNTSVTVHGASPVGLPGVTSPSWTTDGLPSQVFNPNDEPIFSGGQWFDGATGEKITSKRAICAISDPYWKTADGIRHAALADYWGAGKYDLNISPFDAVSLADFERYRDTYDRLTGAAGGAADEGRERGGTTRGGVGNWPILNEVEFYYPGVHEDCENGGLYGRI